MANISTVTDLVINRLSKAKYDQLCASGQLEEYQLYITDDDQAGALSNEIDNLKSNVTTLSTELSSKFNDYLPLSGGNLTGDLSVTNADVYILSGKFSGGENAKAYGKNSFAFGDSVSAMSQNSFAEGYYAYAGLKGYRYTNMGSVTSSLTFEVEPVGWSQGDIVSLVNGAKYESAAIISTIDGTMVTFTSALPFDTIVEDEDYDAKCAYVIAKPNAGNVDLGIGAHAEGSYTSAFGDTSHAEGYGTITDNEGTHAEGGYTSAFGYYSHTEGGWTSTGANAIGAHAEGGFTRADGPISHVEGVKATAEISDFQSFVWQGTDVMPNELTDITPSTWEEYKAHGPGTFNINPVSGLSGVWIGETRLADIVGNAEHLESIEYSELLQLRDDAQLIPGMKYRITDYVTTVDQEDCRSAEHPFDLIVTAIDYHTLDEHAIATLPSNGDDYFNAREFHVPEYQQYLEYARVPLESWDIKYCLDNDKTRFKFADTENGKGVIYYMKDEFGNEAPYDFKNVQFKRYKITSSPGATGLEDMYGLAVGNIEVDESDEMWCYTFNGADYEDFGLSEPYDFSGWHVRPTQAVIQQFGGPSIERLQECTGNVIQARQDDIDDFSLMSFKLPNNIFHCILNSTPVSELPFIKIGYCNANRFGSFCYNNTFSYNCVRNTFGNNCDSNTFGYDCDSNTFGNNCDSNTFGYDCDSNTFGNDCDSNTFGYDCDSNTFGNNCDSNTFGYDCDSNTFGNDCDSNTFGNNCSYIKFAISLSDPSQVKSYYRFITIDSGNQYILLNCTQSTYDGNEYKNVRILPGVNNTITWKTITDGNVNQSFYTTYQPANSQVIAI